MSSPSLEVPPNPDRPAFECRVYERQACEIPTRIHPASLLDMKEAGWDACVRDISQGGVRIRLQRRFERGTGLAVELPGDGQRESTVVFVKVVHLSKAADGMWDLGCKFVSELSDDEVRRLTTCENYVLASRDDETGEEDVAAEEETDEKE